MSSVKCTSVIVTIAFVHPSNPNNGQSPRLRDCRGLSRSDAEPVNVGPRRLGAIGRLKLSKHSPRKLNASMVRRVSFRTVTPSSDVPALLMRTRERSTAIGAGPASAKRVGATTAGPVALPLRSLSGGVGQQQPVRSATATRRPAVVDCGTLIFPGRPLTGVSLPRNDVHRFGASVSTANARMAERPPPASRRSGCSTSDRVAPTRRSPRPSTLDAWTSPRSRSRAGGAGTPRSSRR